MKKIFCYILCLITSCFIFAEVRISVDFGEKFYLWEDEIEEKTYDYVFCNSFSSTLEFTIYKYFEGLIEYEYSWHTDGAVFKNSIYTIGLQYNFSLPKNFYIRPRIQTGLFGESNFGGLDLSLTIPGASPYVGLNLIFAKRFEISDFIFEIFSDASWRMETTYKPVNLSLGINFIHR